MPIMPPKFGNPHLAVIVTNKCNLNCAYCLRKKSNAEISIEELKHVMAEAHRLGYRSIGLTGGEVLLYSGLKELLKTIKELEWSVLFETNGILFNQEWLEIIKKNTTGELNFSVSLDSYKKEEHEKTRRGVSFDRAVATIKLIAEKKHNLRVTCVLHGGNLAGDGDFEHFFAFIESLGTDIALNFQNEVDYQNRRGGKTLAEVHQSLAMAVKKYKGPLKISPPGQEKSAIFDCGRLEGKNLCLSPAGVHPCIFAEQLKLGELKEFEDIHQTKLPAFVQFRKYALAKNSITNGSCADCVAMVKKEIDFFKKA